MYWVKRILIKKTKKKKKANLFLFHAIYHPNIELQIIKIKIIIKINKQFKINEQHMLHLILAQTFILFYIHIYIYFHFKIKKVRNSIIKN